MIVIGLVFNLSIHITHAGELTNLNGIITKVQIPIKQIVKWMFLLILSSRN